jgi:gas vesicle protein
METMAMNDTSNTRGSSNTGSTLMGFALGAVVGAGLALLLAPDSGKKTRDRLASTARRWSKSAGDTIDQARDKVTELGADAKSAVKAGQDAFLHDLAARESRSERRMTAAGDAGLGLNDVGRSGEEITR